MLTKCDLSTLAWRLSGWAPYYWRISRSLETGTIASAEILPLPAPVPGSVQAALRAAGLLPDWNVGMDARLCEWAENRHWMYETDLPDGWLQPGKAVRLACEGLDYTGTVLVNGREVGAFTGTFVPHSFDLTPALAPSGNRLQIVFECAPRWLGQFGYTSRMTEWKPRFNYTWDWTGRLVQVGIWDAIALEVSDGQRLGELRCLTGRDDRGGRLEVRGEVSGERAARVRIELACGDQPLRVAEVPVAEFARGVVWQGLPVEAWQPNRQGAQPLYNLRATLLDANGATLDQAERRVGFKRVEWRACAGAPAAADPWLCVVNGEPIFLQGVNWTPIRPNFADVSDDDYRQRLELYRDLGCNLLRVWGGAFLEKQIFYDLCDELGLLVWQEFPLSSSGVENMPPDDQGSIAAMENIVRSYVARRRLHASLLLWCGGNELQRFVDDGRGGQVGVPVDTSPPMIARMAEIVADMDPGRRFLPTSPSGPRFAAEREFGQGLHWDVHGPWGMPGTPEQWLHYWQGDDALFRSETGAPGASGADLIEAYRGDCASTPGTLANPLWRRTAWWIDWPVFVAERGREPADLEEYVAWSQARQAEALRVAAESCKARFPRCGGLLIWMGHDSFPCAANTSIVDFWGRPKPAALALRGVFTSSAVRLP
jgi:beta-mannosidase